MGQHGFKSNVKYCCQKKTFFWDDFEFIQNACKFSWPNYSNPKEVKSWHEEKFSFLHRREIVAS